MIVNVVNVFFNSFKKCSNYNNKNSVPTKFLDFVNNCSDINRIIMILEKSRNDMINMLGQRYNYEISHIVAYKSFLPCYLSEDYRDFDLLSYERLEYLYNYIKDNLSLFDQFWILINCNNTDYYGLKRVHVIFF